jgi:hypothetical protein
MIVVSLHAILFRTLLLDVLMTPLRQTVCVILIGLLTGWATATGAQDWRKPPDVLPDTQPLTWTDPLDVRLMDGAHRYIDRRIDGSLDARQRHWNRDLTSPAAYDRSVSANRDRFRSIIGAVNRGQERNHNIGIALPPLPVQMQWVGDDQSPAVLYQCDA